MECVECPDEADEQEKGISGNIFGGIDQVDETGGIVEYHGELNQGGVFVDVSELLYQGGEQERSNDESHILVINDIEIRK